ncbi:MAG: HAMP domain-containing sensor histidine kinase [Gammaproteobacteria bacterium]
MVQHTSPSDPKLPARRFIRLSAAWLLGAVLMAGVAITVYVATVTVTRDADLYGHWVAKYLQQTLDPRYFESTASIDPAQLRNVFHRLNQFADIGAVKLKEPSGLIVWADAPELMGRREPPSAAFDKALAGEVSAHYEEIDDAGERLSEHLGYSVFPWLYEVCIPIRAGNGRVVGVVEVYQNPQRILGRIASELGVVWGILLLAALAYVIPTMRLFGRTSRDMLSLQSDLEQSRRLAEVGEYVSMIVHDTRNLLAGIRYTCECMSAPNVSTEKRRKMAADLEGPVRMSFGMMNDLLSFVSGKRPPLDIREHDLAGLLDEIKDMLIATLEPDGHRLALAVTPGITVTCDGERFSQIILNLVRNSTEAMTEPGEVEITGAAEGDGVHVFVDPALLPNVFQPFVSEQNKARPGLGLAIIRDIMDRHGGRIAARNREPRGAEIELIFPAR